MDGGRKKWEMENKPTSKEIIVPNPTIYKAEERDESIRAYIKILSS
jgi:3-mercaptopyruvate sulfurtransferase SseA